MARGSRQRDVSQNRGPVESFALFYCFLKFYVYIILQPYFCWLYQMYIGCLYAFLKHIPTLALRYQEKAASSAAKHQGSPCSTGISCSCHSPVCLFSPQRLNSWSKDFDPCNLHSWEIQRYCHCMIFQWNCSQSLRFNASNWSALERWGCTCLAKRGDPIQSYYIILSHIIISNSHLIRFTQRVENQRQQMSIPRPTCSFSPLSGCHLQMFRLRSAERMKPDLSKVGRQTALKQDDVTIHAA